MNVTFSCILCEKLLYRTLEKSHWLWARDNLDFDRLKFPWLQGVLILQQLKGLLSRGEFFLALTTSPSSNATSSMTLLLLLCNHKINFCCQYVSSRLKLCNFIVWIFYLISKEIFRWEAYEISKIYLLLLTGVWGLFRLKFTCPIWPSLCE